MLPWTFYPAFIGTGISVIGWVAVAHSQYRKQFPSTLSELASDSPENLKYYRAILWVCGPLFAVTLFGFVIQRIAHPLVIGLVSALTITSEMLLGIFTAQRNLFTAHDVISGVMGVAMILSAYLFAWSLTGSSELVELTFAIGMSLAGLLCIVDRKRYIFYELAVIFLAHLSVITIAIALG